MHASLTDAPSDLNCLTGDLVSDDEDDEEDTLLSQEDNQNQNTDCVPIANGHYLALVPGNRRPIDPALAAHFAQVAPPPPLIESCDHSPIVGEQLRRLEQHQEKLREVQERQKSQWLQEEQQREEQQRQLEEQRRDLLQLQLQQQQQEEHRLRRHRLQWQLELEQQYRMHQKHLQQQQQLRRSPTGLMLSPSSGLCTIYEAMETSDEDDESDTNMEVNGHSPGRENNSQKHLCPVQELEWNQKVDMVQQLINQTLMMSGDGSCPLLLLPVGTGGTLSPMESSMWPHLLPQFSPPVATVTSVSSYCPDSRGSSPPGDWTVVEVETQH